MPIGTIRKIIVKGKSSVSMKPLMVDLYSFSDS